MEKRINSIKFGKYNDGNQDRETVGVIDNEWNEPITINSLQ